MQIKNKLYVCQIMIISIILSQFNPYTISSNSNNLNQHTIHVDTPLTNATVTLNEQVINNQKPITNTDSFITNEQVINNQKLITNTDSFITSNDNLKECTVVNFYKQKTFKNKLKLQNPIQDQIAINQQREKCKNNIPIGSLDYPLKIKPKQKPKMQYSQTVLIPANETKLLPKIAGYKKNNRYGNNPLNQNKTRKRALNHVELPLSFANHSVNIEERDVQDNIAKTYHTTRHPVLLKSSNVNKQNTQVQNFNTGIVLENFNKIPRNHPQILTHPQDYSVKTSLNTSSNPVMLSQNNIDNEFMDNELDLSPIRSSSQSSEIISRNGTDISGTVNNMSGITNTINYVVVAVNTENTEVNAVDNINNLNRQNIIIRQINKAYKSLCNTWDCITDCCTSLAPENPILYQFCYCACTICMIVVVGVFLSLIAMAISHAK